MPNAQAVRDLTIALEFVELELQDQFPMPLFYGELNEHWQRLSDSRRTIAANRKDLHERAADRFVPSGQVLQKGRVDDIFPKFCRSRYSDRRLNWKDFRDHPLIAKNESAFILVHMMDPIGNQYLDRKVDGGKGTMSKSMVTWSIIPSTQTGFPGPYYYRDRFEVREYDKKVCPFYRCHICGFLNHREWDCPLSIYLRRTLLRMLQRCFVCLQYLQVNG